MSLRDCLAELVATGSTACLLGNCKLEWGGSEIYGEEAIAELFRAYPMAADDEDLLVASSHHAALFSGQSVLFADLYDNRIGRLWRLGPGSPPASEQAVSVAFDPDLRQQRGGVYVRKADHAFVEAGHLAVLEHAGEALLAASSETPQHRARAFMVRAFSDGERAAALYAVHRLSGGEVRSSSFSYAAVAVCGSECKTIFDQCRDMCWTPRI